MLKKFILISFFFTLLYADYIEDAYKEVTGVSKSSNQIDRLDDSVYAFTSATCCCFAPINLLFSKSAKKIGKKIYPAIDDIVKAVAYEAEVNDLTTSRIKNIKLMNGMYSFTEDKEYVYMSGTSGNNQNFTGKGCIPLDFSKEEDREKYLTIVDEIEGGGDYHIENSTSGAYGRYQFMNSTAKQYCQRVSNFDCCGNKWKTGPNAEECQDEMFKEFTADNSKSLESKNIPSNSCTIYLAHQQGIGGLTWLMTGELPSVYKNNDGSPRFERITAIVKQNVGSSHWESMTSKGQTSSIDGLREGYLEYWNKRLGGDILNSDGNSSSAEDISSQADDIQKDIDERKEMRKKLLREGILLEQKREDFFLDIIINLINNYIIRRQTEIEFKLDIHEKDKDE